MTSLWFMLAFISVTYAWNKHMEVPGMYQGDILLTPEQREKLNRDPNSFGSIVGRRWPGGKIAYQIASNLGSRARNAISAAIADYHKYTCLRFSPRQGERNYIDFVYSTGCNSPVGMYGRNRISLDSGCWDKGTVLHEIGHSIGLQHEQCRPDRDGFVKVHLQNINGPWAYAFNKERNVNSLGTPYDLKSMMHYSSTAFAKRGTKTITTKDPSKQHLIDTYNRISGFSEMDIKQIGLMYNHICTGGPPPSGVPPPDNCKNNHQRCQEWANRGECQKNPRYMHHNCKKSCNKC
ncbi:zinc metalloproteinase nas-15-like [Hydractinia symbiolongicarpus]|uniref:zinc metalloproteinase nas-15-like n=1 Tax=Hydractinia symbiolongicarpus TaxID=13093 RepID=UPI00254ACCEC|nr:zinc metalloproteinase nas-15-like [Hydractinia symbiolongicarpus]